MLPLRSCYRTWSIIFCTRQQFPPRGHCSVEVRPGIGPVQRIKYTGRRGFLTIIHNIVNTEDFVRAGGCPIVIAQWQSTASWTHSHGFDSWWLPACLITLVYMQSHVQTKKLGMKLPTMIHQSLFPFLLWFSLGSDVNYHCIMLCNLVTTLLHKVIYASLGMQSLASKNNNPLWDRLAKLCNQTCFIRGNRRIVRTQELAGEVPACMVLPF